MKKRLPWVLGAVGLSVFAVFFWVMGTRGVTLAVKNSGVRPMTGVVAQTSVNSYPLGDIAPGATRAVRVDGGGGSHVELTYADGSGKQRHLGVDCYFESGFRGRLQADVNAGKIVRVKANLTTR